jgi:Tat protein translocase TatB subunit
VDILGIGFPELLFIFIIALMVFGPRRLPEIAGKAGKYVRDLRNMSQGFMAEWQREITVATRMEEIEQVRKELEETKQALTQSRTEITAQAAQVSKTANTVIGHSIAPPSTPSLKPIPPASETPEIETATEPVPLSGSPLAPVNEGPASPVDEAGTEKNGAHPSAKPEAKPAPVSPTEAPE